jgi:hypothetical protein
MIFLALGPKVQGGLDDQDALSRFPNFNFGNYPIDIWMFECRGVDHRALLVFAII